MLVCITIGGVKHCFQIIEFLFPIPKLGNPPPVNYPQLFHDATIVASLRTAAGNIADGEVRSAMLSGFKTAIGALEKRAGSHVTISAD
jgi:hypothetical protein